MSVLKYKNSQGVWEEVTDINQIITIEVEKPVVNGVWKEIEVTEVDGEFDCSAANIDLLVSENWFLCGGKVGAYSTNGFHAVAADKPQAVIITPVIARLKGADMRNNFERIGLYALKVDGYGYIGFGSDLFLSLGTVAAMEPGTSSSGNYKVYSNSVKTDGSWTTTAKLIYLDNEED